VLRLSTIADLGTLERPLHLALGVFDGVHIGHQAVIGAAVAGAEESGGVAGVLTFEPHPIQVLAPDRAPRRILASLEHKERLLEELGVAVFLVLKFSPELAQQPAEEFAAELVAAPTLRQLSTGEDWKFGRQRAGTVALLESLGARKGVMVSAISSVMMDGERVSSTRLRQALRDGNLKAAAAMLGRPYAVMGAVERGAQLGRALGFPTANIAVGDEQLPPDGVYAVVATAAGEDRPGIANLGVRPTVSGERRLLEVHLLNFEGDLYGADVEVRFGRRLREEKKFADVDALKEQILCDVAAARALFDEGEAMVC
jgi:riboflavin kinase/FMN adenylyltransferase